MTKPADDVVARAPISDEGDLRPWLLNAIVVGALVPLAVLLVRVPFQHWFPVGDLATIALRVREVFTTHTPLVGPYSHFGWSHPGPLLFDVLAVPYRLTGRDSGGLLVGALLVNAVAVVVFVVRLARRGGTAVAMLTVAGLGVVSWSLGTSRLWSIWNPDITVLPFAALIVVVWTMRPGSRWDLPLVAILASFVAQSHIAYVPLVVVLCAWAVAYRFWPANRTLDTDQQARHFELVTTAVILAVAWAPVALDAVLHRGGNLRDIASFWFAGHDTLGLANAFRVVCFELSLHGRLLGGSPLLVLGGGIDPRGHPVPVTLFVLLGAMVLAWRRRDSFSLRAGLLVCLLIVTATISVARVVGFVYPYLLNFLPVLEAAALLVAGITVVRAIDASCGTTVRRAVTGAMTAFAVAMMLVLVVSASGAGIGSNTEGAASRNLAKLLPELRHALGSPAGPLKLTSTGSFSGGSFHAGVLLDLVEHGYDVKADTSDKLRYGGYYVERKAGERPLLVTSGPAEFRDASVGHALLATTGPAANFPQGAPAIGHGEDPARYLLRVRSLVSRATYRRLEHYLSSPTPIAVFRSR